MSTIVLSPGATGAAAFTIEAPSTATSRVITLPDATDTLVGKATTDTLTNKSIAATQLTGTVAAANLPAGSVLQVVYATNSTAFTFTSSSYTNATNFNASITPSSGSNDILVMFQVSVQIDNYASGGTIISGNIVRNSTQVYENVLLKGYANYTGGPVPMVYLDAATGLTSAITYKLQVKASSTYNSSYINPAGSVNATSSIVLMEIKR